MSPSNNSFSSFSVLANHIGHVSIACGEAGGPRLSALTTARRGRCVRSDLERRVANQVSPGTSGTRERIGRTGGVSLDHT